MWASRRGYAQLWAATEGPAVNFYQRCGWQVHEMVVRSTPRPMVTGTYEVLMNIRSPSRSTFGFCWRQR